MDWIGAAVQRPRYHFFCDRLGHTGYRKSCVFYGGQQTHRSKKTTKNKYLLLSDGMSTQTLKWVKELAKYFDLYLISLIGLDIKLEQFIINDIISII